MNRKLQIQILSNDNDQNDYQSNEQFSQQQQQYEEHNQSSSPPPHEYETQNHQMNVQTSQSKQDAYQSVQTFGNHYQPNNQLFIQQIMRPNIRQVNNIGNRLSETPISLQRTPNSSSRKQQLQNSDLDDQINRIISKVNKKGNINDQNNIQIIQIERIKKIDRINKQLLKQNTSLINEINNLQKKLKQINNKIPFPKPKGKSLEDSSMLKTLKSYKQKLEKAMSLNSKLSVRLTSQRSRSNIISNTFRSMVNKQQGNSSEIVGSTIRDQTTSNHHKNKQQQHLYCKKCHKEVQGVSKSLQNQQDSKNFVFSPVLQVKNYEISKYNKTKQFQLTRRPVVHDFECQTNMESNNQLLEMKALQKEEQLLQKIIEENNKKILQYEQVLYKLVEIN